MKQTILITGVSSGIGRALAEMYLNQGDEVYGVSRRTPDDLLKFPKFLFRSMDLSKLEWLRSAIGELLATHPSLDLVILNAATVGKIGDLSENSVTELEEVMTLNVWANKVFLDCVFELCPRVTQVVAISSAASVEAVRGSPGYCLAKAALNMLMALYAEERKACHFSAVAPWIVSTPMQDSLIREARDRRFAAFEFLEVMRLTGRSWSPQHAAEHLACIFQEAALRQSGTFIDICGLDQSASHFGMPDTTPSPSTTAVRSLQAQTDA